MDVANTLETALTGCSARHSPHTINNGVTKFLKKRRDTNMFPSSLHSGRKLSPVSPAVSIGTNMLVSDRSGGGRNNIARQLQQGIAIAVITGSRKLAEQGEKAPSQRALRLAGMSK